MVEFAGENVVLNVGYTQILFHKGKEMRSDSGMCRRYDAVLPFYPGSGIHYIIEHMLVQEGDYALDLCTGSGIFAIYAADKASWVVATDISRRALKFAKKNTKRNKISNIRFRRGDLFGPVEGEKFDYIATNPPFVPVPPNLSAALHSDGGSDGLCLVRRILEQAENYLKPDGRMQMYSLTLGNETETLLEELLRKNLGNRRVTMVSMYSEPLPLEEFTADLEHYPVQEWREELAGMGLTHLHSYIVNIEPGERLEITKSGIPEEERGTFPDNWKGWRERHSFWVLGKK